MALTGQFERTVDSKGRVAIPKPLREAMGLFPGGVLYLAPGTDGSLALYTESGFHHLARRLDASVPTDPQVRAFRRLFYAQARRVEMDSQGRIRIPASLAQRMQLGREVVLLGAGDHVELWDQQRWQAYLEEKLPQYDRLAEAAFQPSGHLPRQGEFPSAE